MITPPVGVGWGRRRPCSDVVPTNTWSRAASDRQQLPLESTLSCCRAGSRSRRRPSRQEADAGRARVALAGGGDDDRLVRVVVPGEDGDAADVDAEGRAEVGQRDVGRAAGLVVRKSVVFQMPPLAPAT